MGRDNSKSIFGIDGLWTIGLCLLTYIAIGFLGGCVSTSRVTETMPIDEIGPPFRDSIFVKQEGFCGLTKNQIGFIHYLHNEIREDANLYQKSLQFSYRMGGALALVGVFSLIIVGLINFLAINKGWGSLVARERSVLAVSAGVFVFTFLYSDTFTVKEMVEVAHGNYKGCVDLERDLNAFTTYYYGTALKPLEESKDTCTVVFSSFINLAVNRLDELRVQSKFFDISERNNLTDNKNIITNIIGGRVESTNRE